MDCRVRDGIVEPLKWRIAVDGDLPEEGPLWGTDNDGRLLAYSDTERDEIAAWCAEHGIKATAIAEDQPDADLLAKLHGRGSSRTEALTALTTGKVPPMLGDVDALTARVKELENSLSERTAT